MCWIVAIGLSVCVGLHVRDLRALTLFAAAALATAALPADRIAALITLGVGLAAGTWATALIYRGSDVSLAELVRGQGPGGIGVAACWLLIASGIRSMWA